MDLTILGRPRIGGISLSFFQRLRFRPGCVCAPRAFHQPTKQIIMRKKTDSRRKKGGTRVKPMPHPPTNGQRPVHTGPRMQIKVLIPADNDWLQGELDQYDPDDPDGRNLDHLTDEQTQMYFGRIATINEAETAVLVAVKTNTWSGKGSTFALSTGAYRVKNCQHVADQDERGQIVRFLVEMIPVVSSGYITPEDIGDFEFQEVSVQDAVSGLLNRKGWTITSCNLSVDKADVQGTELTEVLRIVAYRENPFGMDAGSVSESHRRIAEKAGYPMADRPPSNAGDGFDLGEDAGKEFLDQLRRDQIQDDQDQDNDD